LDFIKAAKTGKTSGSSLMLEESLRKAPGEATKEAL
jgi:hypothetical protein